MAWGKTYGGAEPQRVNKWLAGEGVCSRREAEEMIANGLVSIDGARVEDPGRKIERGQTLELADGRVAPRISIAPIPQATAIQRSCHAGRSAIIASPIPHQQGKSSSHVPMGRSARDRRSHGRQPSGA